MNIHGYTIEGDLVKKGKFSASLPDLNETGLLQAPDGEQHKVSRDVIWDILHWVTFVEEFL